MADSYSYVILLFAMLREKVGDSITVDLPQGVVSVEELKEACSIQFPQITPWLPHTKVAVNQIYVNGGEMVRCTDEIAFIPPVAGG